MTATGEAPDEPQLAGSAGPHVFVSDLDLPVLGDADESHVRGALRMRDGDALTVSDGANRWRAARLRPGTLEADGPIIERSAAPPITVAFSLVKGAKPELLVQKLTELGVDHIVALRAERSVVRWDETKTEKARERWNRVAREAAMQSHRCTLPSIELLRDSVSWLADSGAAIAHFGGQPIASVRIDSVAIGPEGGWSPAEIEAATGPMVSLGTTVLRAETAGIAAGTLLVSARSFWS